MNKKLLILPLLLAPASQAQAATVTAGSITPTLVAQNMTSTTTVQTATGTYDIDGVTYTATLSTSDAGLGLEQAAGFFGVGDSSFGPPTTNQGLADTELAVGQSFTLSFDLDVLIVSFDWAFAAAASDSATISIPGAADVLIGGLHGTAGAGTFTYPTPVLLPAGSPMTFTGNGPEDIPAEIASGAYGNIEFIAVPAPIPEPSSVAILAFASLSFLGRRKRA